MTTDLLLESHLKSLPLPAFLESYQPLAHEAARTNLSYERYLLALAQEEVAQREAHRIERAAANAHFPVLRSWRSLTGPVCQMCPNPGFWTWHKAVTSAVPSR